MRPPRLARDRACAGAPRASSSAGAHGTVRARRAVIAVPPPLLDSINFEPGLPPSHAALADAWRGGNLIKLTATYAEPFWRDDDLSGEGVGHNEHGEHHLRQHAALGNAWRARRLRRRGRRTRLRGAATTPAGARSRWVALRGFSAPRRSRPTGSWSATGSPRSGREAARSRTWARVSWRSTAERCASPPARSTSPPRSTPRRGAATWTARCARAKPPRSDPAAA